MRVIRGEQSEALRVGGERSETRKSERDSSRVAA
jgi:hypothetical protein